MVTLDSQQKYPLEIARNTYSSSQNAFNTFMSSTQEGQPTAEVIEPLDNSTMKQQLAQLANRFKGVLGQYKQREQQLMVK